MGIRKRQYIGFVHEYITLDNNIQLKSAVSHFSIIESVQNSVMCYYFSACVYMPCEYITFPSVKCSDFKEGGTSGTHYLLHSLIVWLTEPEN